MNPLIISCLLVLSFPSFAQEKLPEQGPKRVLLRKAVPGMCFPAKQVIEPYNGNPDEVEPVCSVTKEELIELLNNDLQFLKNNPEFKGRGMISVVINCEGKVISWAEVVKSRNKELNEEILAFLVKQDFDWEPGKYKEETIDSVYSFSYQIIRGKLRLN